MGFFSGIPILGGLIDTIGGNVIRGREAFRGNAENEQQRIADEMKDVRKFQPQGWLGKQIRPLITLVVFLPFIAITVILTIVCIKVMIPLLTSLDDIDRAIEQMQLIFSLYDALPDRWWMLAGIVVPFWFGGRTLKHWGAASVMKHVTSVNANRPKPEPKKDPFVDVIGDDIHQLSNLEQARRANQMTK